VGAKVDGLAAERAAVVDGLLELLDSHVGCLVLGSWDVWVMLVVSKEVKYGETWLRYGYNDCDEVPQCCWR
jgi:hypothetical protein